MGESELKIALQQESEEGVRALWAAAEENVAKCRRQLEAEEEQVRMAAERKLRLQVGHLRNGLLAEARTRAMAKRLHAEAELDARLQRLARKILSELAEQKREALWPVLCAELPPAEWSEIRVQEADRLRALRDFPAAEVEVDEHIAGGLVATGAGGGFRVDNSLDCRLLRAWPELLPKLMRELRQLVAENEIT